MTNFHSNESPVTEDVLPQITQNLQQRGNLVEHIRIPDSFGYLERAKRQIGLKGYFRHYEAEELATRFLTRICKENPHAIIIDMHTTPMQKLLRQKRKKIKVREGRSGGPFGEIRGHKDAEISLTFREDLRYKTNNAYVLELPAATEPSPQETQRMIEKMRNRYTRTESYYAQINSAKKTRATNLLNPRMIRRICHLIDTTAKTHAGEIKKPKRELYQVKQQKPPLRTTILFRKIRTRIFGRKR